MDDVQALRQEILLRANDLYEKREYARAAEVAQELLTVLPEDVEIPSMRARRGRRSISTARRGSLRRRSRICAR